EAAAAGEGDAETGDNARALERAHEDVDVGLIEAGEGPVLDLALVGDGEGHSLTPRPEAWARPHCRRRRACHGTGDLPGTPCTRPRGSPSRPPGDRGTRAHPRACSSHRC